MAENRELLELTRELIRSRSYSGEEKGVADILAAFFKRNGIDDITIDRYGNIIATLKGDKPGENILFDGHIDTVRVLENDGWTKEPFEGTVEDGKMYGRGTSDMKGADAAMAVGMVNFYRKHGKKFSGSVSFAGVVHEECFEGVASREVSKAVRPDIVVIGEASELNLKIGQRGRAEIWVETFGKNAHSSNPEKGINAVYAMNKLITRIRELKPSTHPGLKPGIMELTDIKSSPYPGASVVPNYCKVTYDRRLMPGETKESVLKPIRDIIEELEKEDPTFQAKVSIPVGKELCYTGEEITGERFFPGWIRDEKEEYIVKCKNRLDELGINPEIKVYDFCTNASHYAGEAGIRAIGFGPSPENLAHTVDEYIMLDDLEKACIGYEGIMEALLLD